MIDVGELNMHIDRIEVMSVSRQNEGHISLGLVRSKLEWSEKAKTYIIVEARFELSLWVPAQLETLLAALPKAEDFVDFDIQRHRTEADEHEMEVRS